MKRIITAVAILAMMATAACHRSNEPQHRTGGHSLPAPAKGNRSVWGASEWTLGGPVSTDNGRGWTARGTSQRSRNAWRVLVDNGGRGYDLAEMRYDCASGRGSVLAYYHADTDGSPEARKIDGDVMRTAMAAGQATCATGPQIPKGSAMDALRAIRAAHPALSVVAPGQNPLAHPDSLPPARAGERHNVS